MYDTQAICNTVIQMMWTYSIVYKTHVYMDLFFHTQVCLDVPNIYMITYLPHHSSFPSSLILNTIISYNQIIY